MKKLGRMEVSRLNKFWKNK